MSKKSKKQLETENERLKKNYKKKRIKRQVFILTLKAVSKNVPKVVLSMVLVLHI